MVELSQYKEIVDGQMDRQTARQTDNMITTGHLQCRALIMVLILVCLKQTLSMLAADIAKRISNSTFKDFIAFI